MSLEQAILDHAAAIRGLAAAILGKASAAPIGYAQGDDHMLTAAALRDKKAAAGKNEPTDEQVDTEIDAAARSVEAQAKAELEKSVSQVEAAAKNGGKSTAGTATPAADTQTTAGAADTATAEAQTSYDYAKDVAPVLTKVAQKSRDSLVALLAKFGAKKGNELKAEQYGKVLAAANELLAG